MFSRLVSAFVLALALSHVPMVNATAESLENAVEAWLANNDEIAIPALAALAHRGNVQAQRLLGKIATRPFSPFVAGLPHKDRIELLRAPGGLSGRSWLKVAAEEGDALAAAFVAVEAPPFNTTDILALLDNGEDDAAAIALLRATAYGRIEGLSDLLVNRRLLFDVAYTALVSEAVWGDAPPPTSWRTGEDPLRLVEVLAFGAWTSQRPTKNPARDMSLRLFPGDYHETNPAPTGALLAELAPVSRPAQRLLRYCQAACGDAIEVCMGDTVALVGGYNELWQFGPPVQSLISEDRYLDSPRFHADIARQLKTLMGGWSKVFQKEWTDSSCAAASRFRTRFP